MNKRIVKMYPGWKSSKNPPPFRASARALETWSHTRATEMGAKLEHSKRIRDLLESVKFAGLRF
jgi:hypothetical protein